MLETKHLHLKKIYLTGTTKMIFETFVNNKLTFERQKSSQKANAILRI